MSHKVLNLITNWSIYENIREIECNVVKIHNISKILVTQSIFDLF